MMQRPKRLGQHFVWYGTLVKEHWGEANEEVGSEGVTLGTILAAPEKMLFWKEMF